MVAGFNRKVVVQDLIKFFYNVESNVLIPTVAATVLLDVNKNAVFTGCFSLLVISNILQFDIGECDFKVDF